MFIQPVSQSCQSSQSVYNSTSFHGITIYMGCPMQSICKSIECKFPLYWALHLIACHQTSLCLERKSRSAARATWGGVPLREILSLLVSWFSVLGQFVSSFLTIAHHWVIVFFKQIFPSSAQDQRANAGVRVISNISEADHFNSPLTPRSTSQHGVDWSTGYSIHTM